ncbi:MAG: UDP-N-acetylmuramoyl-tripeptide--D-alanyl-D-alanine ligase [Balneolales bacterium]|nr:UDP-N-acetylmuramoyl-tripeptide--D-alanyl-D-alanine ligase [Balneolales bacterium]
MITMSAVMMWHLYWRTRFFVHTFQLSGYKLSEFWSWLKENWNTHVINLTHAFSNILLLVMVLLLSDRFTQTAPIVLLTISMTLWYWPVDLYRKKEKKPLVVTSRVQRLLVPIVFFGSIFPLLGVQLSFLARNMLPDPYILTFGCVFGVILIPFVVLLAGLLTKPVETFIQRSFIRQAQRKLASMPNLKVIGITGSYGKTSTKFALATLLSERYSVCFTPGSFNTPMGICKVINNDLEPTHQILILEMGARYKGNIKELCDIAHPNVAVLTNIGKAHMETFGSQQAIAQTKGELLEALHPGEVAIVNADDALVMERAHMRNDISLISAGVEAGDFRATNIRYDANGCSFTVTFKNEESVQVQTPLLGLHNVQNILLGFAVGHHFGLRLETMALAASRIEPVEHRLELKPAGKYTIIDDAFNSNPVGARNAIDVLAAFEGGRRIVVTPGMVELGDIEVQENTAFGEHIGRSGVEIVVLVGPQQTLPIRNGLRNAGYPDDQIHIAENLFEANNWIKSQLQDGDFILYENDLPDTYIR